MLNLKRKPEAETFDSDEAEDRYYCLECGILLRKRDFDSLSPIFPKSKNPGIPLCPNCLQPFKCSSKKKAIALMKKKGWIRTRSNSSKPCMHTTVCVDGSKRSHQL